MCSPSSEQESDDEMSLKPAKKRKVGEKPITDFFGKAPTKAAAPTARKASGSQATNAKAAPAKKAPAKKVVVSDDDESMDDAPPPPPKRAARKAAPKTYIDIESDEDGDGPGSEFEDFD